MKYIRRLILHILSRLFIISIVIGIFLITFYYAMNASSIYIIVKEGMEKRAQVIMYSDDVQSLNKYFLPAYLQNDKSLQLKLNGQSPYSWYKIRGIDHRIELNWLWAWPWDNVANVEFIERIPLIDGNILPKYREIVLAQGNEKALYPPKWHSGKYTAILVQENGKWLIKSITQNNNWEGN